MIFNVNVQFFEIAKYFIYLFNYFMYMYIIIYVPKIIFVSKTLVHLVPPFDCDFDAKPFTTDLKDI